MKNNMRSILLAFFSLALFSCEGLVPKEADANCTLPKGVYQSLSLSQASLYHENGSLFTIQSNPNIPLLARIRDAQDFGYVAQDCAFSAASNEGSNIYYVFSLLNDSGIKIEKYQKNSSSQGQNVADTRLSEHYFCPRKDTLSQSELDLRLRRYSPRRPTCPQML